MSNRIRRAVQYFKSAATLSVILLVCSTALNVALAREVSGLRSTIRIIKEERSLKVGSRLPIMRGHNLDGSPVELDFTKRRAPTVVYVFTPTCGWCLRNIDNLKTLASAAGRNFELVAVSLTEKGLSEYVRQSGFNFPVLSISQDTQTEFKLGGTPQTLLVGIDGVLQKNWKGAYQGNLEAEVEKQLAVELPGLLPAPSRSPSKP